MRAGLILKQILQNLPIAKGHLSSHKVKFNNH